ncbi:hypothetical protein [uncultured Caulobacter sp.]|uniref:hypothetical protein n=1 Tax=uncultured Caulobacter sp. TaxID=158749 RepID=UPI002606E407|nr:hypothetical protein [uncultured Caulobacter sp.]
MAKAAATIDIVVAERVTGDYAVATTSSANRQARANYAAGGEVLSSAQVSQRLKTEEMPDGARIHYRVVERLKGEGSRVFSLNGIVPPDYPKAAPSPAGSIVELRARLNSQDLSEWPGFGACIQPLWTGLGHRYVVFRDARGQLLAVQIRVGFDGRPMRVRGPSYVEVGGPDDPWLRSIRRALNGMTKPPAA